MLPFPIMNGYGNTVLRDEYKLFKDELMNGTVYTKVDLVNGFNTYPSAMKMYGTVIGGTSGTMWGSPYNTRVTHDSRMYLAVRHMYPSQAMWTVGYSAARLVAFTCSVRSTYPSYLAVSRNGLTSSSYGSFTGLLITDFIYYDEDTKHVMRYNPSTASTPVRYYNF